ncbi:MAG: ornithine carbamoyltransferase [Candidatus Dormibacteraeota bacterium]|uniref:Ornithine carbamoyltransferase n=1 Tax=Candidatus Aeolococcus gillhamiae TaxID=3127015 RepID=A0A2W5YZF4_9BACT|nr:ornithine carbamoyltransferase [Candidatus Dormibacteraeota bacterium]PZR78353.1 MAG: ornithine carbamoyltransferase [Candidatus Dormibacter sp. RRmetagenome_bin12]
MSRALSGRDLLSIADLSRDEINTVLDLAGRAKRGEDLGAPLHGRNLALIFQRPSNRTRVSFEVAINRLGGHPIALFGDEIRLGERETASDIARILDRYADGVIARLTSQRDLVAIAAAVRGPVISGMTDAEHPCQLLADLMTVRETVGKVAGARVAYIGDGNNVCTSWLYAAVICGLDLRIVAPPGYEPAAAVLDKAGRLRGNGTGFSVGHDPAAALRDVDVVYTDVWTSMGQEAEQQRRREDFGHLQVNEALLALAPPQVRVMHCLPAHRGEEITGSVLDGPRSVVFDQAENRLWAQMALLALVFEGVPERSATTAEVAS